MLKIKTAITTLLALVVACSSAGDAPRDAHEAEPIYPVLTGNETGPERNALAARLEATLLDAPDSEYTIKTPSGREHYSCPPIGVPNGAVVDTLAGKVYVDGKFYRDIPRCKYKHHLGAAASARAAKGRAAPVGLHPETEYNTYGIDLTGNSTPYAAYSVADAHSTVCVYSFPFQYCKPWINAIGGYAYVPPTPAGMSNSYQSYPTPGYYWDSIHFFNGITDEEFGSILQPVFEYGMGYGADDRGVASPGYPTPGWYGTSWEVAPGFVNTHSPPIVLNAGDELALETQTWLGANAYGCDVTTGFNCGWEIHLLDLTLGTRTDLYVSDVPNYMGPNNNMGAVWRAVLENWDSDDCRDYPAGNAVFFGTQVDQPLNGAFDYHVVNQNWWNNWQGTPTNTNSVDCGFWTSEESQQQCTIHMNGY